VGFVRTGPTPGDVEGPANNFVQVTLSALRELLGPTQNFSKEMIAGPNFRSEFGLRIARDVDLSAEMSLDFPERGGEPREADSANDEQVHVTRRVFLAARDGSVNEGNVNSSVELLKQSPESWQQPSCLFHEAMQVGEQRGSRVGLDVGPSAFTALFQDSTLHESLEVPLQARRGRSEELRQLRQVPPFVGLGQRCGEYLSTDGWK
jgi:hypothetical protein